MPKTVVITGTASGMGKAAVAKFAAEGWNVVATVRKESDLTVHHDLPSVRTLLHDVNDETVAEEFAAAAAAQFGRVDVLVNNAGHYLMGPVEAFTSEQIHRQFQDNVFGAIALSQAFIPGFRQQHSGAIVNIASLTAEQGYPYSSVYSASKAAIATFSEGLSLELAQFGITVRAVLPGQHATRIFTKTDIARGEKTAPYQDAMEQFFGDNTPTGSDPSVTAEVIYQAATDPDPVRVRYYSAPDSVSIPRAKQILGLDVYWREFREFVYGRPSALWRTLTPTPGDKPVEWVLS
jgi:NAD(P)-dependent dehydrogenase (short-subunit alcohol dehydrogenase family)